MFSYENFFKLLDTKLTKRRSADRKQSDSGPKNGSKVTQISNDDDLKKEKCVSKSSSSSWSHTILNFLNICAISVLIVMCFYLLPWENWVFSEDELQQLAMESGEEVENFLATADQTFDEISIHEVPCKEKAYWREIRLNSFVERCGLMVVDDLLPDDQISKLRKTAEKVLNRVGDISQGNRESINLQWVNLHNLFKRNFTRKVMTNTDFQLIRNASEAAREAISIAFGIPEEKLYFNMVSQFTRYRPLVKHTEFRHVDKARSPALLFTSILWLSTSGLDFGGGWTSFLNGPGPEPFSPVLLEPKKGRFAAWTSGFENPHEVKELYWGNRYALIFAFTVSNKLGQESMEAMRNWAINATASEVKQTYTESHK